MAIFRPIRRLVLLLLVLLATGVGYDYFQPNSLHMYDPTQFAERMKVFAAQDRVRPPPQGAVLAVGSSSLEKWVSMEKDFAPLPVVNRGVGRMRSPDPCIYYDNLVKPYAPSVILYYCGDNDPDKIHALDHFRVFAEHVWRDFPKTRLLYLSIKPSPKRAVEWPTARSVNQQARQYCETDPRLHYVDITRTLLDGERIREECFQFDRVHIKLEMYAEWTKSIRPVLEQAWAEVHPTNTNDKN